MLCKRNVIVFQKYNLDFILCVGVVVYKVCNGIYEFNRKLCICITRSRFSAEHKRYGLEYRFGVILNFKIQPQNTKSVQKLSLISMYSLNLNIKNRVRIDNRSLFVFDKLGKSYFIFIFYFIKLFQKFFVIAEAFFIKVIKL